MLIVDITDYVYMTHLSKVCRIPQHVDVEKFGHIAASVCVVFLPECVTYLCTLLLHHGSLVGSSAGGANLPDQVSQPLWGGHDAGNIQHAANAQCRITAGETQVWRWYMHRVQTHINPLPQFNKKQESKTYC